MGSTGKSRARDELYQRIYEVVKKIPRGSVATYGQVAELAGMPGAARLAGTALKALKETGSGQRVPWQRVVGKRSKNLAGVSILDPVGGAVQRALLEDEGISFSDSGAIRLVDHGWLPVE